MQRQLLNLALLRGENTATAQTAETAADTSHSDVNVSRRRLIGVGGIAALAMTPLVRALGAGVRHDFVVEASAERVAFLVDGRERWTIDTARFGGDPRILCHQSDDRIELALTSARYPGTDIPADFDCVLKRGLGGWSMKYDMRFGRFHAEVPFEQWLLGIEPLRSTVQIDSILCSPADGTHLRAHGLGAAQLLANWSLRVDGNAIASYSGMGEPLQTDSVRVTLLASESGSVLADASPRRSLIEIDRGVHEWLPQFPERVTAGWRLTCERNAFDQISIEADEGHNGAPQHAIVAESMRDDALLSVQPCSGFTDAHGRGIGLPLRRARYAAALDTISAQHAIIARYSEDPVWLHTNELSLLLGDDASAEPFELISRDGEIETVRLQPALHSTYVGVDGAIAQPGRVPDGARAHFRRESDPPAERDATEVRINNLRPDDPPIAVLIATPTVPVIRHEDLLHIEFEFVNMTVQASGGRGVKGGRVAVPGSGQAYLVAHFPPQNIAEQAFFEKDNDFALTDSNKDKPVDPDAATGNENPLAPLRMPVRSLISGPSRLAFKVPGGTTINLDIETLLKAITDYEPSLAPTALPPQYVGEIYQIIDIDALKAVPAWSSYGKRAAIENMSSERLSPLVKTAGGATFSKRPQDMLRGRVDTKANVTLKPGAASSRSGIGRLGPAGMRSGTTYSNQSIEAAKTASTRLVNRKDDIESIYQIDASDLEYSGVASIDKLTQVIKIRPRLARPTRSQTAIESPFRLIVSPNSFGRWTHALTPVTHTHPVSTQEHTELWHTRLAVEGSDGIEEYSGADDVDEQSADLRTIRAIWVEGPLEFDTNYTASVPHYKSTDPPNTINPFRMSLDAFDRFNIVHLSANWHISLPATGGRKTRGWYEPLPIKVDRLMLSSLGSWMNVRGAWEPPNPLSVEEWRHRGTMGRDHYVRVVYKGYLFPFGHRASLIKITERKFHKSAFGNIAYLRQRMYIVVRQPERTFRTSGLVQKPSGVVKDDNSKTGESIDLKMPFHKIRILTLITPNLDPPEHDDLNNKGQEAFWPMINGKPFLFQISADDLDNQKTEMAMPLVFIENSIAHKDFEMTPVRAAYEANTGRSTIATGGQKIAFAESEKLGDTSYETESITFGAAVPLAAVKLPPDQPRFYPVVTKSSLSIPAIKYLASTDAGSAFKYNSKFLQVGFDAANQGKVMMDLATSASPVPLSFDAKGDRSGGLVKPNMNITGLSRAMGPIAGDVAKIEAGSFDPASFFAGMNAKLFGVINLWDILQALGLDKAPQFVTEALTSLQTIQNDLNALKAFLEDPAVGGFGATVKTDIDNVLSALANILTDQATFTSALQTFANDVRALKNTLPTVSFDPGLKRSIERLLVDFSRELDNASLIASYIERLVEALQIPKEIKVSLEWAPELQSWPSSDPIFVTRGDGSSKLRLGAEMVAQTSFKSEPKFEIYCRLENFDIDLIGPIASFIVLHFERIEFFANSAMKADVNCVLQSIEFVGVLSFVETLKELIPLDGFSDPPALEVTEKGIDASFSIALPNIAFGVFSLQNLSLGAGFTVPFIGEPLSFRFNFCSRENPFLLTISAIGGGGFFGITINPSGVHILEASFEVGVQLAVDFGVASGSVYAFAGVYFKMEGDNCSLTGYFRLGGEVEVLGIVSVSIELYLSMTYEFSTGKLVGRATLTISIEVLFFEATVEISCEKKFSGSNGDPTFAQLMEPYSAPNLAALSGNVTVNPWQEYVSAFDWN